MRLELLDALRDDLTLAGFFEDRVRALLGSDADEARARGVRIAASRVLAQGEPHALSILVRLLLIGEPVAKSELELAFPRLGADGATELGLVEVQPSGEWRASLSLNPIAMEDTQATEPLNWWVLSDLDDHLRQGPAASDHVMGVGGATRSLIAQLPPGERMRTADIGTGCGIVAMHLALRGTVVATDISSRALMLARANAHLNGVNGIEFRQGDLFAPLEQERFDLIASNPPFVVTPRLEGERTTERYEYRDGGLVGDALAERVVREAPARLAKGGTLVCLANWESRWGAPGLERVRQWIEAAHAEVSADGSGGLAAWVIERDSLSPLRYAEMWARDGGARPGGEQFEQLVGEWLRDFADRRVVSLGLGSIRLRRLSAPVSSAELGQDRVADERPGPLVRTEHAEGQFSARPGRWLESAFDVAITTSSLTDEDVLQLHWALSDDVVELREHRPGHDAPRGITLTSGNGLARRVVADPLLAAALGASDGELSLEQIADALATLLEVDNEAASEALVTSVRELVWLGMLAPADS